MEGDHTLSFSNYALNHPTELFYLFYRNIYVDIKTVMHG